MNGSLALSLYLGLSRAAHGLAGALLQRRVRRGKEDAARIGERLGRATLQRPDGRLIWLHGASVGEAMSILPLVHALLAEGPDVHCLVTTGTVTSAKRIAGLLPDRAFHQFVPVDTQRAVTGFLDHWRPDRAVWVESELWPCLMVRTAECGIPMMLVNARMSENSASSWGSLPGMARRLIGLFTRIVTQDEETVARLSAMGARPERVRVGGNLKALAPVPDCDPEVLEHYRKLVLNRRVWLAASTHPGEEEVILDAHTALCREALLILAPRHPERGRQLATLLEMREMTFARLSSGEEPGPKTRVLLADTLGQMGLWLRLAPVTFVGGSLAAMGGHTPFEPSALGSAILHGPHTENFAPAYRALAEAGGARLVSNDSDLAREIVVLMNDPSALHQMTEQAQVLQRLAPDPAVLAREILALDLERA
ncbi:MAG: 3-deoxy-D-manno-octulosonic acid transferase [Pseudomonadota bacterium]